MLGGDRYSVPSRAPLWSVTGPDPPTPVLQGVRPVRPCSPAPAAMRSWARGRPPCSTSTPCCGQSPATCSRCADGRSCTWPWASRRYRPALPAGDGAGGVGVTGGGAAFLLNPPEREGAGSGRPDWGRPPKPPLPSPGGPAALVSRDGCANPQGRQGAPQLEMSPGPVESDGQCAGAGWEGSAAGPSAQHREDVPRGSHSPTAKSAVPDESLESAVCLTPHWV